MFRSVFLRAGWHTVRAKAAA